MMPNEITIADKLTDVTIANNALENPIIYRYAEVCYAFLKSNSPIHPANAATCITKQSEKQAFFQVVLEVKLVI
jgi:hypothetical protein